MAKYSLYSLYVIFIILLLPVKIYAQYDICTYCNGQNYTNCDYCNGIGCSACHNSGKFICPFKQAYPLFHPEIIKTPNKEHRTTNNSTSQQYSKLNNTNLVDNSEKILQEENYLRDLKQKKQNCYLCHGSGKVPGSVCFTCRGTGTVKVGSLTPQYFHCHWCGGTGRKEAYCPECQSTNMFISIAEGVLKSLKETHGMTKDAEKLYYDYKNQMTRMEIEYQNSINAIADSYINKSGDTRKSGVKSSLPLHSNGEPLCPDCKGSGKCHICNGDKYYENSYDNYRITDCDFCKHTGTCPMCHGRGSIR